MYTLRNGNAADIAPIARLQARVLNEALRLRAIHTPEQDLAYFAETVFPRCTVWVAEAEAEVVGFIAYREGWIEQLYVAPTHHGRGIGTALLRTAQAVNSRLDLWCFQQNTQARSFYEARGFRPVAFTDGSDNDEKLPDVRYAWSRTARRDRVAGVGPRC